MILECTDVGHIGLNRRELHAVDLAFICNDPNLVLMHVKRGIQIFQRRIAIGVLHGHVFGFETQIEFAGRTHGFAAAGGTPRLRRAIGHIPNAAIHFNSKPSNCAAINSALRPFGNIGRGTQRDIFPTAFGFCVIKRNLHIDLPGLVCLNGRRVQSTGPGTVRFRLQICIA